MKKIFLLLLAAAFSNTAFAKVETPQKEELIDQEDAEQEDQDLDLEENLDQEDENVAKKVTVKKSKKKQDETPATTAQLTEELKGLLIKLTEETKVATKKELKKLEKIKTTAAFSEAELIDLCNGVLEKIEVNGVADERAAAEGLRNFVAAIVESLKEHKVFGFGLGHHVSGALFYSHPQFTFDLAFKGESEKLQTRRFAIDYTTFGWKNEFLYRASRVFVTGNEFNLHTASEKLELGRGYEIGLRLPYSGPFQRLPNGKNAQYPLVSIGITILPFKSIKAMLVIVHAGAGITGFCNGIESLFWDIVSHSNLSIVYNGGSLTPVTA
jgi:hypothetical protein